MFEIQDIYIMTDDDTYLYGDNTYQCYYCKETDTFLEPFILNRQRNRVIKFYRSKNFFAVYRNNILMKIIKLMTCRSEDYKIIYLKDNIAYKYTETVKGRYVAVDKPCNDDYTDFIRKHRL